MNQENIAISRLQEYRRNYVPQIPQVLQFGTDCVHVTKSADNTVSFTHTENSVPGTSLTNVQRVGVVFSGGQAPGGHNVIAGLFDAIKQNNPNAQLLGFHMGVQGLLNADYEILQKDKIDFYRNTGGFTMIGSGRTKIEDEEQIQKACRNALELKLDGLVIIGGDDSNTNAQKLSEIFVQKNIGTTVVGVPKTIDGDLKNEFIEASFGFDTAAKVYSEMIGSVACDTSSSKKYWNFIKLMGRSASHIALECALETHPNICLIGEEIKAKKMSLHSVVESICKPIVHRANEGKNFGIVLIPEGIVEFIPETEHLIKELDKVWEVYEIIQYDLDSFEDKCAWLKERISPEAYATFTELPKTIAKQFLSLRDPHGNLVVSLIDTEKLFASLVKKELTSLKRKGIYRGKFSTQTNFYGYEGRSTPPSNFDANYCYALGKTAFLNIAFRETGTMACIKNLGDKPSNWICKGIPLSSMMTNEIRKGYKTRVIKKCLVNLNSEPFLTFSRVRDQWAVSDNYIFNGPIQYYGPDEICNKVTCTLELETKEKLGK